jgi:hypothetical protein
MRITNTHLELQIERLNELTNSPKTPYTPSEEGTPQQANVGNHHLSGAYGGFCVHRMANTSGGVSTPISYGHIPKRELYEKLASYIAGIETGKSLS